MYRAPAVTVALLFAGLGLLGLPGEAAGQTSGKTILTDGKNMDNFDQAGNAAWRIQEQAVAAERGGNRYSAISIAFPDGPHSGRDLVNQAMAQIGQKGDVRTQLFTQLGLGRQGGQMNIFQPNGRQLRAAVYMAQRRLTVVQADAVAGDPAALQFEQSIALIDKAGNDLDRVNPNNVGITRK